MKRDILSETTRLWLLIVAICAGYIAAGWVAGDVAMAAFSGAGELPKPDWRDLIIAIGGAIVGWLTRWLQQVVSRPAPALPLPPQDRGR